MVLAATNQAQNPEVAKLQQQIHDMQKQLIQKYVDGGQLTSDQGKAIQDRMDQQFKNAQENGFQPGAGCGAGSAGGAGCIKGGGCGNGGFGAGKAAPQSFSNF